MGNPITDLWGFAVGEWRRVTTGYGNVWRDMYDTLDFYAFKAQVQEAFQEIGQALEAVAVLNATSDADTVQIGRDIGVQTHQALTFLRFWYVPREASNAKQLAMNYALQQALNAERFARKLVRNEHLLMLRRVAQEAADRKGGDWLEHQQMVFRVTTEHDDRVRQVNAAIQLLTARIDQARKAILAKLAADVAALNKAIAQLTAYARSLPGLIDLRAANGYDPTLQARAGTLQRLLDTAAAHEPLIADLVTRIAAWLVDLAEVDDPVLRVAAQLAVREIIDHLGLDTALGKIVNDLLGGILGTGPPRTLTQVTAAAGNRLNAAEDSLSQLSPLAPEADNLHEMGTVVFDAALIAYLAGAVADPRAAADDTTAALEPVVTPLLAPVRALLGMP